VTLIGVEAGGRGAGLGDNAASLTFGTPGVLQGSYTLILQDEFGQVRELIRCPRAWIIPAWVPSTPT